MQRLSTSLRWLLIAVILLPCVFMIGCSIGGAASPFEVITHPDGLLYVGDQVSFEVLAPAAYDGATHHIEVLFQGKTLGSAGFASYGIGRRSEAELWWVWDTHHLDPGTYTLTFTSLPDETTWSETVFLLPADQVPPPAPQAHWVETTTVCCNIYYISGTDAARDINSLGQVADEQSAEVAGQMHTALKGKITLIFMPRVLGNGGFTAGEVYVSYLDNNYLANNTGIILHHEFVHFYDGQIGGTFLPSIFLEGLAVYLTGGHFKPEPIAPRAAALLDLGWYIPLQKLADDFYNQQHEIGYIEAAGLVKYLVDTYGWTKFNEFYRTIPPPGNQKISAVIDISLRNNLGISFNEMEAGFQKYLESQTVTSADREDLQLTVEFFNTARRYQQSFDPSAYFLTAWLPDGTLMRQRGITADLLRHPQGLENRYIESQLKNAWAELSSEDYSGVQIALDWINAVLGLTTL